MLSLLIPGLGMGGGNNGDVTVSPAAVTAAWAAQPPSLSAGASVSPATQGASWSAASPVISGGATAGPGALAALWSVQAPAVSTGGSITVAPAALTAAWACLTPSVSAGASVSPGAPVATWTVRQPVFGSGAGPAQVITVADACAAAVLAAWQASATPPGPQGGVSRVYEVPLADPEYLEVLQGRQVWVFPAEYGRQAFTRSQDNRRPKIAVVIAERYTAQAPVPTTWLDDRVAFVEQVVFGPLADPRRPAIYPGLIPEDDGASVVVYDAELLIFQRLFVSMVTIQYRLLYP